MKPEYKYAPRLVIEGLENELLTLRNELATSPIAPPVKELLLQGFMLFKIKDISNEFHAISLYPLKEDLLAKSVSDCLRERIKWAMNNTHTPEPVGETLKQYLTSIVDHDLLDVDSLTDDFTRWKTDVVGLLTADEEWKSLIRVYLDYKSKKITYGIFRDWSRRFPW